MALGKQNVSISFSKGLDTKTDNKQVIPGKMLTLENAILKKVGKFTKRFGYGVIANNQGITNGNSLATFKNELIAYDGDYIYSFSSSDDKLYSKGTKVAVDLATQSVARNSYEQTQPDCAVHSVGISVFAWQDSSGGVRYSIFDTVTQQAIVSNRLINATGSKPKVKVIGSYILIFFIDGTNLNYYPIDSTDPTAASAEVLIANTVSSYFDVTYFNSLMYVAWSTGTTISIVTLSSALVQSATLTVSAVSSCLGLFHDPSDNLWVSYASGNDLKYFIYDKTLVTQVLAPTLIETGTAPFVNVTGVYDVSQGVFFYEVTGDIPSNQYIKSNYADVSGGVDTSYVFFRSVGLYSKIFKHNNINYMVVTHESDLQPTYFVINLDQKVVAKIAPALGGGLSTTGLLAEVNLVGTDQYIFAYEYKDFVQSVNGDVTTQTGVNGATLNYSEAILNQEIGNNLHSSGGIISAYDGQTINELGFNLYPEVIDLAYNKNGGTLYEGSYGYATTYEWTDSQGQIHRSAPFYETLTIDNNETYFKVNQFSYFGSPIYPVLLDGKLGSAYTGDVETSLQNIFVGKKLSIPAYGTTYVTGFADFRAVAGSPNKTFYIWLSNPTTTATGLNVTATSFPESGFNATSIIGNDDIFLNQVNFLSYVGTVSTGSNIIYMPKTQGLFVGMQLFSANNTFPIVSNVIPTNRITAVYSDRIELNINAVADGQNITFHFHAPLYGSGSTNSFTYNEATYGPMNYFIGQNFYSINGSASVLNPTNAFGTITNVVNLGGGLYQITTSVTINYSLANYCVGLYPTQDFYEKEEITATANFENPLTVVSINNVFQDANQNIVTVNKQATLTGSTFINVTAFAAPSINVDTLRITDKENVVINVYRTIKNGTVYYQTTSINGIQNNKTVDLINYIDAVSDEVLVGNQQLYTTGGEVENIAPPASNIIGQYKNRLLVVPNEDPLSFWYSKQVRTNTPIEFNDSFVQRSPEKGGPITALQQMDDKLLIFKQDYIFVMVGDGPSVSGINNDFTDPQLITADAGCNDKKSVVVLPTGVIFKSQKGFYFLDRALNVKYIGADVESFNSYSVTSAKMIETENQVRFTISSGDCLVYDYYVEQWAVFKDIEAADAVNFQDKYTYIVPSGEIRRESSSYLDDTSFIPMAFETGWLNLAGLQGYTRIYHILIVGTYKSPHTLKIELYRDFIDTPFETVNIPVLTAPTKYQYRVFPSIQKCESIKIKITELQSAPYGEGFDISAINLEVGVKRGQNRISPDESFG